MSADSYRESRRGLPLFPAFVTGLRFGARVITAELERDDGPRRVRTRCDCGRVREVQLLSLVRTASRCQGCAGSQPKERQLTSDIGGEMREARLRAPDVWHDEHGDGVRISAEDAAWNAQVRRDAVAELAALCGPMSLAEVGELFDTTKEGMRQSEARALRNLGRRLRVAGVELPAPRGPTYAEIAETYSTGPEW